MSQILFNGLAMGSIYALVALSFVLVYNAVGVVNFATGEVVMIGAFVGVTALTKFGLGTTLGYVATIGIMVAFGYFFNLGTYFPLRGQPTISVTVSTLAAGIILRNMATILWGPDPLAMPAIFGSAIWQVGDLKIVPQQVIIFGVTLVLLVFQYLLFSRTRWGRMMRAAAQDREAARLMGIRVDLVVTLTFVYAAFLGGVAGLLLAPVFFVETGMGFTVVLKAFASSVVGGFGSVQGAVLGGLFIGVTEIMGAAYISTAYKDAIAFIILIVVLMVRPRGFFGEKVSEKA